MSSHPFDLAEMKKYRHLLDFEQEQNKKLLALWEEVTRAGWAQQEGS